MTDTSQPDKQAETADAHDPNLAHHFHSLAQQYYSARLGMWFFLITEILFFSGLFCAYAVYRANRPEVFLDGHYFLSTPLGALNTAVLLFSSLTMALAVRSAQLAERGRLITFLAVTALCGIFFLGVKSVEYQDKWNHRLVPGQARITHWFSEEAASSAAPPREFKPDRHYIEEHLEHAGFKNLADEQLDERIDNLRSFVGVYFALTGLHAVHVIIGIGVILWLLVGAVRGRYGSRSFTPVDLSGLYWHLVDLIWIYLFPLLYLIP